MAQRGGQPGNTNAAKGSTWNDAIRRAMLKRRNALDKAAEQLLAKAEQGEEWAIKELGNRLDGKSVQGIIDYTPPPEKPPVLNIGFTIGGPGAEPAKPDPSPEG